MKRIFTLLLSTAVGISASAQIVRTAAAFTPGNIAVYRVSSTVALANTATAVFIDEYTPAGVLVQSIAMPTAAAGANKALTAVGNSTTEGMMTRSADGQYLIVPGYDAVVGTATPNASTSALVNRVVGRVDAAGTINTTTSLTDAFSTGNIRSATSTNGTDLWMAGSLEGVRYATLGSTTSTLVSSTATNLRGVGVYGGQLYASTAAGTLPRMLAVGTGTPTTTGQTMVGLTGFPVTGVSYNEFLFADLDATVAGVDVLYVADETSGIGVQKYSYNGTTWVSNGNIGLAAITVRGLAGTVVGNTVTLYTSSPTNLYQVIDVSGYNATMTGTMTSIATAAANNAFRGAAMTPQTALPLTLTSFKASLLGSTARLNWTSQNEVNVKGFSVEKSLNGTTFSEIAFVKAKNGASANTYSAEDANVKAGVNYYRLKMVDVDGAVRYSNIVSLSNKGSIKAEVFPNPAFSTLTVSHNKAELGAVIRVMSIEGKQVKFIPVEAGAVQTALSVNDLVKGNYLLVYEANGEKTTTKFSKQ
jgi:hypothetical protein